MRYAISLGLVRAVCVAIAGFVAAAAEGQALTWLHAPSQVAAETKVSAPSRALDGNELLRIGHLHEVQNHLQEALPYYQRAVTAFHKRKNQSGEAAALVSLGGVLHRQGKDEEALIALRKAVTLLGRTRELGAQGRALLALGLSRNPWAGPLRPARPMRRLQDSSRERAISRVVRRA